MLQEQESVSKEMQNILLLRVLHVKLDLILSPAQVGTGGGMALVYQGWIAKITPLPLNLIYTPPLKKTNYTPPFQNLGKIHFV